MRLKEKWKAVGFCWCPSHVRIHGNEKADELATEKSFLDAEHFTDELPNRDWYSVIRKKLKERRD